MPELPEVETTRRGIEPYLVGRQITALTVRQRGLRWPVAAGLERKLAGLTIDAVERRAKYLLLVTGAGTLMVLTPDGRLSRESVAVPAARGPIEHDFEIAR